MDDIYALLNLNGEILSNFAFQANLIENKDTERTINRNVRKLEQIGRRHDSEIECKMSAHSINVVVQKVLRKALENSREDISFSELRIISYNLSQFHGAEKAYFYALTLLEEEWKDMFLRGIASYLLTSWNYIREDYRSRCIDLFTSKAQSYSGTLERYLTLQANVDFFKDNGPMRLAALISRKGIQLKEAPMILGYKQVVFSSSYFSDVIIKYIKNTELEDINFLEDEIFAYHQEDRTKKLVYAYLVSAAEQRGDTLYQRKISASARRILGDISLVVTWAPFEGATEEEVSSLHRASELVNLWMNRLVIEIFFEVCVQDKAREKFWTDYAKDITDFKIAGSSLVKRQLQQDPRIDPHTLNRCFVETNSKLSRTSALILVFKGKAIVEFSDVGSVYAYNVTNSRVSSLLRGRKGIEKTEELKDTSMPILVESQHYYSGISEQGKLPHRGEWEPRLRRWLKEKVFVSTNIAPYQHKVDKVFSPQPLSYNKPKLEKKSQTKKKSICQPSLFDSEDQLHPDIKDSGTVKAAILKAEELELANHVQIKDQIDDGSSKKGWSTLDSEPILNSKWVFNGLCRVLGTASGFYLHIKSGQTSHYAKIGEHNINTSNRGNIWIKRFDRNWLQIVYSCNDEEYNLGLIKCTIALTQVLYRKSKNHFECESFPID